MAEALMSGNAVKLLLEGRLEDAWLSRAKDPKAAKLLIDNVSSLSEEVFSAGWRDGMEYNVWEAITEGGPKHRTYWARYKSALRRIQELSAKAGGWMRYPGDSPGEWMYEELQLYKAEFGWDVLDPLFVTMEEWIPMYEVWRGIRENMKSVE